MRLHLGIDIDGKPRVVNADTGEALHGCWRFELRADASVRNGRAELVLFLDPRQHALNIEGATVTTELRPRPAGHFGPDEE